jgi:prepilin-type N-terminal cleavage/methylation domain-containing protein
MGLAARGAVKAAGQPRFDVRSGRGGAGGGASGRIASDRERACGSRGFSLIELMVVIIVIGVIAVMAIPTMSVSRFDRLAYNDAGAVMQLLRAARTRAIARGGAVLVSLHANASDRGTFQMYEAVTQNALAAGLPRTPVSNCKSPTDWTLLVGDSSNPNLLLIDGVNLNGDLEVAAGVSASILMYTSPTNNTGTAETTTVDVCWTPVGRSYIALGSPAAHLFDGLTPTISPLEIDVQRTGGGTVRSVLLPPNGMARLFSHVAVAQ